MRRRLSFTSTLPSHPDLGIAAHGPDPGEGPGRAPAAPCLVAAAPRLLAVCHWCPHLLVWDTPHPFHFLGHLGDARFQPCLKAAPGEGRRGSQQSPRCQAWAWGVPATVLAACCCPGCRNEPRGWELCLLCWNSVSPPAEPRLHHPEEGRESGAQPAEFQHFPVG